MEGLRDGLSFTVTFDDRQPLPPAPGKPGRMSGGSFRAKLCAGCFMAAFAVLGLRVAHVSIAGNGEAAAASYASAAEGRREVTDRRGRPLIMNASNTGLAVDGRDVWDVDEMVEGLAGLFPDIDTESIGRRLADGKYVIVHENITEAERQQVVALGFNGIRFPEINGRAYPQRDLAAHVLGYTVDGRGGMIGIEKALEGLAPADGPLALSLDLAAQQILEEEVAAAIRRYNAKAGWGVLMNVKTGEVRALASLPDFNPNRPGAADPASWRNRAMSDRYELGSAFKPITVAAAMERGVVRVTDKFDVAKPITVGGWTISDFSQKKPVMTVSEIVQYSSNIGTIKIAQALGAEAFEESLAQVGLTSAVKTELPEAREPAYSTAWRPAELAAASYGHGIAVSPLALTAAFASVVNGGVYRVPTFIEGGETEARRVFSGEVSDQMRLVLRRTVTDGTGGNADVPGYYVIGKTASADKPTAEGYAEDAGLISSFLGAFPGHDPQYALLVSLDEPEGIKANHGYATAGYVAAPVFKRVVERAAPVLGVMPVGDDVAFHGFVGLTRQSKLETNAISADDALAQFLADKVQ